MMIEGQRDSRLADVAFYTSVLDALEAHIAVLDQQGTILAVNTSWQRFGEVNAIRDARFGVGVNYFAICRAALDPVAREAAEGIREVLDGHRSSFSLEYPCHSPDEERYFTLRATPLSEHPGLAVVAHENITERVLAARASMRPSTIDKLDLVISRFPGSRDQIERLIAAHPEFLEICEDYEEQAAWINDPQRSNEDIKMFEDSTELLDSLAEEIRRYLSD